jgi:RHS repeat-associated protein
VTSWGSCSAQTNEERGFTGHEMLDELGFVHMNGRLYDPITGRFLQADPIIQDAYNSQNYNRYSYVMNNPLSMTDPTGLSWWTKWRKTVFSVVAAIAVPWALGELFMGSVGFSEVGTFAIGGATEGGAAVLTTAGKAVSAMAGGFAAGGIAGGNIQSALQGAFTAALTFGVGEFSGAHAAGGSAAMSAGQRIGQIAGHAAVGCASAAAAGGSCRAGAMSAGFSALAGHVPGISDTGLIGRMAVGAIAAKAGGGKAENGALSAAFEYLFNRCGADIKGCLTEKQAAVEASKEIYEPTKRDRVEYGGLLYKDSVGMYHHTEHVKGSMISVDPATSVKQVPSDAQVTGAYHSHPPNSGLFNNAQPERFSVGDMSYGSGKNSLGLKLNVYLVAPSGRISMWDINTSSPQLIGRIP